MKKPFAGPESVLKYLALYPHRVAISEKRIVSVKDHSVTFTYKDYADGCKEKLLAISVGEFARRFLLHTLPKAFVRIRYYGFLASVNRQKEFNTVKGYFNIKRKISLLPLKPHPCPHCGSVHIVKTIEIPKLRASSYSHKTKVLPLVA